MTLSPRDRRAILLGAVGLLIILAGRFVLLPWIDSWKDARRSIAEARVELGEAERQIYRVLGQRRRLEKIYGPAVNKALDNRQSAQVKLIEGVQEVFKTGFFRCSDRNKHIFSTVISLKAADTPLSFFCSASVFVSALLSVAFSVVASLVAVSPLLGSSAFDDLLTGCIGDSVLRDLLLSPERFRRGRTCPTAQVKNTAEQSMTAHPIRVTCFMDTPQLELFFHLFPHIGRHSFQYLLLHLGR